jgi:hypothetical protein
MSRLALILANENADIFFVGCVLCPEASGVGCETSATNDFSSTFGMSAEIWKLLSAFFSTVSSAICTLISDFTPLESGIFKFETS